MLKLIQRDMKMYNILSIDAWGNAHEGYEWNDWHKIAECETLPESDNELFDLMIEKDLIVDKDLFYIEYDGYNIVFCWKENLKPVYAIEYGNVDNV